jgi:hypothetical protein
MLGSGLTGTGTDNADSLLSSGGPNTLVGLGGNDLYYLGNADRRGGRSRERRLRFGTDQGKLYSANQRRGAVRDRLGLTGTGKPVFANTLVTIGANTLVGLAGNDTFVFLSGSADGATVADFDHAQADLLVFGGFGTAAQARP